MVFRTAGSLWRGHFRSSQRSMCPHGRNHEGHRAFRRSCGSQAQTCHSDVCEVPRERGKKKPSTRILYPVEIYFKNRRKTKIYFFSKIYFRQRSWLCPHQLCTPRSIQRSLSGQKKTIKGNVALHGKPEPGRAGVTANKDTLSHFVFISGTIDY